MFFGLSSMVSVPNSVWCWIVVVWLSVLGICSCRLLSMAVSMSRSVYICSSGLSSPVSVREFRIRVLMYSRYGVIIWISHGTRCGCFA